MYTHVNSHLHSLSVINLITLQNVFTESITDVIPLTRVLTEGIADMIPRDKHYTRDSPQLDEDHPHGVTEGALVMIGHAHP